MILPSDIAQCYQQRLKARMEAQGMAARQDRRLSNARLLVFLAGLALLGGMLLGDALHPAWLAVPGAAFLALVVVHDRTLRRLRRTEAAVEFYRQGLLRLQGRWQEHGNQKSSFAPPDHPFAADLDLFGPGSLFQLMCRARTLAGEETLASYLLEPASPEVIRQRQAAVLDLRDRLDLREDLALLCIGVRAELAPGRLESWALARSLFVGPWASAARCLAILLPGLAVAASVAWALGATNFIPLLGLLIVAALIHRLFRSRLTAATLGLDRAEQDLQLLSQLLNRIESERFTAPLLLDLADKLAADGQLASTAIRRLSQLVRLLDSMRNSFFVPLGLLLMWSFHFGMAIDAWRLRHGPRVALWLSALGSLEALSSLSGHASEHPDDPFPEMVEDGPLFEAEDLGHPLLPEERCVRNSIRLDRSLPILIVSGSNMSGKSTLLRTVGVAAIMAQCGAPVCARRLRLSPLSVGATLKIQDSLQSGTSRFYQEIQRIKQILDLAHGDRPLLFLLDEVLHGTNSHDRLEGASAILRQLLDAGALGLCTTHDLALADAADRLHRDGGRLRNVHFVDHLEDGKLVFDYRLHDGVVTRSNAIALMRAVGLEV